MKWNAFSFSSRLSCIAVWMSNRQVHNKQTSHSSSSPSTRLIDTVASTCTLVGIRRVGVEMQFVLNKKSDAQNGQQVLKAFPYFRSFSFLFRENKRVGVICGSLASIRGLETNIPNKKLVVAILLVKLSHHIITILIHTQRRRTRNKETIVC